VNCVKAEFADESVAFTVWVPYLDMGILIDPVIPPVPVEVIVAGLVVMITPSYLILVTEFAAKPPPEIFTVVPLDPEFGFNDMILFVVTVNGVCTVFDSVSVALIVCCPLPDGGTKKDPENPPVALEVIA
jgi:hypothetical protein